MIGLFGTIITAAAHVALRRLRLTDHPLVIVNYFGYLVGLISFYLYLQIIFTAVMECFF
jgi:hypothetical protein